MADAWGQIELAGIVAVDPPVDPHSLPDAGLTVVDGDGDAVAVGTAGEVVLCRPWAGTLRAVEGEVGYDHWGHRPGVYSTGDRAVRREDGRLEFLGRIDPAVSLSGQLVSLTEIRDVLLEHPFLQAAEVVAVSDAWRGRRVVACVVPKAGGPNRPGLAAELVTTVRETLGGLARPRTVLFADRLGDDLPPAALQRGIEIVASSIADLTADISWSQIRAAASL